MTHAFFVVTTNATHPLSVVTTDGILLTKSGTMTGGTTGGIEARSNKWDDKKIEGLCFIFHWILNILSVLTLLPCLGLKKKKEQLESELEAIGSPREMQLKETEVSVKISGLEKKMKYAEIEKVSLCVCVCCVHMRVLSLSLSLSLSV